MAPGSIQRPENTPLAWYLSPKPHSARNLRRDVTPTSVGRHLVQRVPAFHHQSIDLNTVRTYHHLAVASIARPSLHHPTNPEIETLNPETSIADRTSTINDLVIPCAEPSAIRYPTARGGGATTKQIRWRHSSKPRRSARDSLVVDASTDITIRAALTVVFVTTGRDGMTGADGCLLGSSSSSSF